MVAVPPLPQKKSDNKRYNMHMNKNILLVLYQMELKYLNFILAHLCTKEGLRHQLSLFPFSVPTFLFLESPLVFSKFLKKKNSAFALIVLVLFLPQHPSPVSSTWSHLMLSCRSRCSGRFFLCELNFEYFRLLCL